MKFNEQHTIMHLRKGPDFHSRLVIASLCSAQMLFAQRRFGSWQETFLCHIQSMWRLNLLFWRQILADAYSELPGMPPLAS